MRIFYDNIVDGASVAITAGTYDPAFPPANIANELRGKPYRTGTGTAAETLLIDLGSAKAVTAVILLDHTIANTDTTIKLQGNATNSWGAPTVDQVLTWASGTISQTISSQTLRYWRIIFTKSDANAQRDIGRVFLGTYLTPTDEPADLDAPEDDLSKKVRSDGGQLYCDAINSYRVKQFEFTGISTTQKDAMRTLHRAVRTHTSFFLQTDPGGTGEFVEILYGKLRSMMRFRPDGFHADGNLSWRTTLEFEEAL